MPQRTSSRNRRVTLGPVSINGHEDGVMTRSGRRRQSVEPSAAVAKSRPPRGSSRKSMLPRVGRENMVPQSPAVAKPTASSANRRKSTASSRRKSSMRDTDRRQSMVPSSSGPPAKVDPRPIGEKAFQQECIRKLMHYLSRNGYEYPMSQRTLARPSGKDFSNIITFLLRKLDPNFQVDSSMKMEDEIAMNFKALGYPFTVSKTALVAAGSPHTWPALLAALTWLMEHIQVIEGIDPSPKPAPLDQLNAESPKFESLDELEQSTDRAFFVYLTGAYQAFLQGDEAMTETLESALADRFERDDAIIEHEIEHLTDVNGEIVERINHLSEDAADIPMYEKKKKDYETDLEQFQDLLQQMNQHVSTLEQKKKERTKALNETNRTLERTTAAVDALKETVTSQALSQEDVVKMKSEKKGVEEAIERANSTKELLRKTCWEAKATLDSSWNALETVVAEYNSFMNELQLLPLVSIKGIDNKIVLNKNVKLDRDAKVQMLGGVDMVSTVQPALSECKLDYANKLSEAKWKYQDSLNKLEVAEDEASAVSSKLQILEEKLARCEETLQGEQQANEAKVNVRTREVEGLQQKVAALRDPVAREEQLASLDRQASDLETQRVEQQRDHENKKTMMLASIAEAVRAISEYEQECIQKVAALKSYVETQKQSFQSIKMHNNASQQQSQQQEQRLLSPQAHNQ